MSVSSSSSPEHAAGRAARLRQIVEDCLARRLAGEAVPDEEILSIHPDLLPELADELRALHVIQQAQHRAQNAPSPISRERPSDSDAETRLSNKDGSAGMMAGTPAPTIIPGYEIKREIHRGGQGVVYEALQKNTRRAVAIKVMKEGPFAGPGDRARFEREVRILAQLKHPHIVAIHDSGIAAGSFFYVMDYITGRPLSAYIEEIAAVFVPGAALAAVGQAGATRKPVPSVRETMRLFAEICEAVNVAHLRGVIHRDLKPGNIRLDPSGQPHILDFGLAKLSEFDVLEDTPTAAMTQTGQFIGSLPWASPEQTQGKPGNIDLRTDVYALGVILYQMLIGRFPYVVTGVFQVVITNILHAEPVRPSTLRDEVDDEAETIVLKCLNKERERRYQSAGEIARDIRRYLAGEPIEAKRDSAGYILRKQLRRYKLPIAVAAGFVIVVTAGLLASLWFWRQATVQRDEAVQARAAEKIQRELAESNAARAKQEATKAAAVNQFLQDMLASVSPYRGKRRDALLTEALDEADRKVQGGALRDQPSIEAAVRMTLGNTYQNLGLYPEAEKHLERALEIQRRSNPDSAELAVALHDLGTLRLDQQKLSEAEALFREALALRRRWLGEEHPAVAESLNRLASTAYWKGDLEEAETLARAALAMRRKLLGNEHVDVTYSLNTLASVLAEREQYAEAEQLNREDWAISQKLLGAEHPHVATVLSALADVLSDQGRGTEAEPLYREALRIRRKWLGDEHPDVSTTLNNLALLLKKQGKLDEAESFYRESLVICRKRLGNEHPDVAICLNNLASLLEGRRMLADAESFYREALAIRRKTLGTDHADSVSSLNDLAGLLEKQGRCAEAESCYREILAIRRKTLGDKHVNVARGMNRLAIFLQDWDRLTEAEPLYREALAMRRKLLGNDHPLVGDTLNNLATLLQDLDRPAEAEPLLREALAIRRATLPAQNLSVADTLIQLGRCLTVLQKPTEAESLLCEGLDIQLQGLSAESRQIGNTKSLLGACLAIQNRFQDAEQFALEGLAILQNDPGSIKRRIRQAMERLAELYEIWGIAEPGTGKAEKAGEWRAKLAVWGRTSADSQPVPASMPGAEK